MKALLDRFIPEARDLLESSSTGLLKLERAPNDAAIVNEVFRAVHTLKGSSGLFPVPALTRLVHAAEDLLGAVRACELAIDPDLIDQLLEALDQVGVWIDHLEVDASLPETADGISNSLAKRLRRVLSKVDGGTEAVVVPSPVPADQPTYVAADTLAVFSPAERKAAFAHAIAGARLFHVDYRPAEDCFFNGTDPLGLMLELGNLEGLAVSPASPFPVAADRDPYRCNLNLQALVAAPAAEIEQHLRYELDRVTLQEVRTSDLIVIAGRVSTMPVFEDFRDDALALLAKGDLPGIRAGAATLIATMSPDLAAMSALAWLVTALDGARPDPALVGGLIEAVLTGSFAAGEPAAPASAIKEAGPQPVSRAPVTDRTIGRALDIAATQMRGLKFLPYTETTLIGSKSTIGNLALALGREDIAAELATVCETAAAATSFDPLIAFMERLPDLLSAPVAPLAIEDAGSTAAIEPKMPADLPGAVAVRDSDPQAETKRAASRTLKVDQAKVDALMNLIGELVVSKNSLPFLAKRAEEVHGSREMSREIKEQYAVIDRLAQEMQSAIMQVRMLPISDVFDRFPRLVRDLSRRLGKDINLVIDGGETAADKNIIEALNDPLLHIVRNSLDHGIETPEERKLAGKAARATVGLKAYQEADYVVIEITDDGRGIDPAKIRASAVKKGVIEADEAERLSDQEAIHLIFRPGFSTAEKISDLSGRGVGMDVVRTVIEKLGGRVSISSRVGEGSNTRLTLPLSMAITRVMLIEAANGLYGVPMDLIVETVRVAPEHIHQIQQAEAFILRDQLIPLVRMANLLQQPARPLVHDAEAVLVCRIEGRQIGFIIDDFRVGMDVIVKPLEGIVAHMRGFSGTTLLGDGRVLLVLDLKELI